MTTSAYSFVHCLPSTEEEYNDIYNELARRNGLKVAPMREQAEALAGLAAYILERLADPAQRNCHAS